MATEIPCAGTDCFDAATCEVIPRGRWRNHQVVKACKKCAQRLAAAYVTNAGERGWADIEKIVMEAPVKKNARLGRKGAPK